MARQSGLNPLVTDFYELTMASVYFAAGRHKEEATFYLYWRSPPFQGSYTLAVGLQNVIAFLQDFYFSDEDLAYLASLRGGDGAPLFRGDFLAYLRELSLDLEIAAVPEGTVMLAPGPVLRVSGPLIQGLLIEAALLNIMNAESMVATRAARITNLLAPYGANAVDFSLRRSPNLGSNLTRAAFIGGISQTSHTHAARELGCPVVGTMAHSFVMSFAKEGLAPAAIEQRAFRTYMTHMRENSVLLVDTFDSKTGIAHAIQIARELQIPLKGLRLDSGQLYELTWYAHAQLEQARAVNPELFGRTFITVSNSLDEIKILELFERSFREKGRPFPATSFGIGSCLGNPGPLNGGVYKLAALSPQAGCPMTTTLKVGERLSAKAGSLLGPKTSLPGVQLDTLRLWDEQGFIAAEVIVDTSLVNREGQSELENLINTRQAVRLLEGAAERLEPLPAFAHSGLLLRPLFQRQGGGLPAKLLTQESQPLSHLQDYAKKQLASLAPATKELRKPSKVPVYLALPVYKRVKEIIGTMI